MLLRPAKKLRGEQYRRILSVVVVRICQQDCQVVAEREGIRTPRVELPTATSKLTAALANGDLSATVQIYQSFDPKRSPAF
jgi:hypothetical protein